jgi:GxxExxY protein
MDKLLYEELTYKINGAIFKVYNSLGYGYKEKEYQKALSREFGLLNINYQRELYSSLTYEGTKIAKFFVDFLVEDLIIVELKVARQIYKKDFEQVLQYLKSHDLRLGIIAAFTPTSIIIKRIIN